MICHTGFRVKDEKTGEIFRVPCGQCYACKTRKTQEWVARLLYEERHALSSFFVTLTYNSDHIPLVHPDRLAPYIAEGKHESWITPTLQKSDLQKYFKRLRHEFTDPQSPLKYFACGEYGTRTCRPHYHAIIFNCKNPLQFQDHWQFGDIHCAPFTSDTAAYVVGYANKPKVDLSGDPRAPEFRIMSKGLGTGYCDDPRNQEWHLANPEERFYIPGLSNTKTPLPRLFKQRLYPAYKRKQLGKYFSDKYGDITEKLTPEQINQQVLEQMRKLKLSTKNRNL